MSPFGPSFLPQPRVYSQPLDFVGPLFSYSYELFVVPKTVKSFAIKQIRTLCAKYRGCGGISVWLFTSHRSRVTSHVLSLACSLFVVSLRSFPDRFPLFSTGCSLFLENTRGGGTQRFNIPDKKQEGTQARALLTIPINCASTMRRRPWRSCPPLRLRSCTRRKR